MIIYKNILSQLKDAGYNTTRIRKEKILPQSTLQRLRNSDPISTETLNIICTLLDCQPGDILEYIPDEIPNEIPNDETLDSFSEIETGNGTHFKGNTKDLFQNLQESED